MTIESLTARVKQEALKAGFDAVGISQVTPLLEGEQRLHAWLQEGMGAGLGYMHRTSRLRGRPADLVPEARSIVSLAVNYYNGEFGEVPRGHGRIARYAWGLDYHEVIPPRLHALVARIESVAGHKVQARCFVDAVPLLERAIGQRSGIGRVGLNSCLITDHFGSWVFLSEILLDLELAPDEGETRPCISTLDCMKCCPTRAIVRPHVVDARRCISYHTIENRQVVDRGLRPYMGDWLFGCDVCQEVCPHNEKVPLTTWPEFRPESGIGKSLSLLNVLSIRSDEEFKQRFKGTALLRARRCGLLRSAVIVAANKAFEEAVPMLHQLAQSDPDAIVRGHTVWALLRFPSHASEQVVRSAATEENALVRQEALWVQQKWDEGESGRELLDV